jgi:hypothetical protein
MIFTFKSYEDSIKNLFEKGYIFTRYANATNEKSVILRHDVDFSIKRAASFAEFENTLGVKSTYFVLLCTDFYNVFSKSSKDDLIRILSLGHDIGLHFDETKYIIDGDLNKFEKALRNEVDILSNAINYQVKTISMHRPSKFTLEGDFQFEGLINSYSKKYFNEYKYVSDSRMNWRENLDEIINSDQYNKLHILTHPFWYDHIEESVKEKLDRFCRQAVMERYKSLEDNVRDLSEILEKEDVKV